MHGRRSSQQAPLRDERLTAETGPVVLRAAKRLLSERDDFNLSEIVDKIDELSGTSITALTRRRLLAVFSDAPLSTELDPLDLLREIWPLHQMASGFNDYTRNGSTMEDHLIQHTVRNDDMTNRDILEAVGMLTCSRRRMHAGLGGRVGREKIDLDDLGRFLRRRLSHGSRIIKPRKESHSFSDRRTGVNCRMATAVRHDSTEWWRS